MPKRLVLSYKILPLIVLAIWVTGCATGGGAGKRPAATVDEINTRKASAAERLSLGDYQGVVDVLLPVGGPKSRDGQVGVMLGEAYWRLGDYENATAHFEHALRLDHTHWEAHMKLAQMLTETGKTGRALTEFELAIKYADRNPLAHYNYGLSLFEFGRRDEAIAQWEMAFAVERNPEYAQALGMAHSPRDSEKALEYFELADELGATSATFHNNFGLFLNRRRDYERAEAHFLAALAADPDNAAYRSNLALLYMNAARYDDAIPLWRGLLDASPDDRMSRIYLGKAYYETKRFDLAADQLEGWLSEQDQVGAAKAPGPDLHVGYDVLAMSYRRLGDLDRALANIRRAVELQPESPIYLNNYGVILAESGRIDEARAQWVKLLDLEPDNAAAKQNLSAFDR